MTVAPVAPASASKPPTDYLPALPVEVGADHDQVEITREALLYGSFKYFMSELHDERGEALVVEEHHEEWADLLQWCPLLCLMAPRDHGKSVTARAYLLWRLWKHNRDPHTGHLIEGLPEGRFQAVVFSATLRQAEEFFEPLQGLVLANEELFADILPIFTGEATQQRSVWSRTRIRFRNGGEASIRAYRTSTRGLHPDLILGDDVLNEQNTLTAYQRQRSWQYFVSVLMPMNASQVVLIGTAFHYDDLLHRLKPDLSKAPLTIRNRATRERRRVWFRWVKYRAVNWDNGEVLWADQHDLEDLEGKRDVDPLLFAREYQNDPRDDASSLFPYSLTNLALNQNATFLPLVPGAYRPPADEVVLLGEDIALSESVGADYTVIKVVAMKRQTLHRRLLWAYRAKGMTLDQQIEMLRKACNAFGVTYGIIEQNAFQKWLQRELVKYPETAGRIIGHNTGTEKRSLSDGVPSLKIGLEQGLWEIPAGDEESRAYANVWQSELNAFGWKDDKLQGVGEHDDTVMATWFVDLAARQAEEWIRLGPASQLITQDDEELFERVRIGTEY